MRGKIYRALTMGAMLVPLCAQAMERSSPPTQGRDSPGDFWDIAPEPLKLDLPQDLTPSFSSSASITPDFLSVSSETSSVFSSFYPPLFPQLPYVLPQGYTSHDLLQAMVLICCGSSIGTGVALDERHILTVASNLFPHLEEKKPILVATPQEHLHKTKTPWQFNLLHENDANPLLFTSESLLGLGGLKVLTRPKVHVHPSFGYALKQPDPIFQSSSEFILHSLLRSMQCGLPFSTAELYEPPEFFLPNIVPKKISITGVDMAILAYDKPHGLPYFPVPAYTHAIDLETLHILGGAGCRYNPHYPDNVPPVDYCYSGCVEKKGKIPKTFHFTPHVYAQAFRSVGYAARPKEALWLSRMPLAQEIPGKFLLNNSYAYEAPAGYGAISLGDRGAGVISFSKRGTPELVGLASSCNILPSFKAAHTYYWQHCIDVYTHTMDLNLAVTLHNLLRLSGFSLQTAVDIRPHKPWIDEIISGVPRHVVESRCWTCCIT